MPVRRGSRHVWSGCSADFRCSILPSEGACMKEGLVAQVALLNRSADLIISRGVLIGYYASCSVPVCTFLQF